MQSFISSGINTSPLGSSWKAISPSLTSPTDHCSYRHSPHERRRRRRLDDAIYFDTEDHKSSYSRNDAFMSDPVYFHPSKKQCLETSFGQLHVSSPSKSTPSELTNSHQNLSNEASPSATPDGLEKTKDIVDDTLFDEIKSNEALYKMDDDADLTKEWRLNEDALKYIKQEIEKLTDRNMTKSRMEALIHDFMSKYTKQTIENCPKPSSISQELIVYRPFEFPPPMIPEEEEIHIDENGKRFDVPETKELAMEDEEEEENLVDMLDTD